MIGLSPTTLISLFTAAAITTVSAAPPPWDNGPRVMGVFEDVINPKLFGPLHGSILHADGGKIWIGKNTGVNCAPGADVNACHSIKDTVIRVWLATTMSMDVSINGGQQLFIDPRGALLYVHPSEIPKGSIATGFQVNRGRFGNDYLYHKNGGNWMACPQVPGKSPYQIYFNQKPLKDQDVPSQNAKDCVGISFAMQNYNQESPAAYEYTQG
ncbi:hypothetical protein ABW20_dc0100905 [Dactylellina cionopaga]|nr:hypothetical protein ABW20_dc0100905 [Dactylellina cionopaga]